MGKVRIAIVGVGNCASSLVQGLEYYKDAADGARVPGLMHVRFGSYHVSDVQVVAAFDVDTKKVGVDLAEAIQASENNTIKIADVAPTGVTVQRGPHTGSGDSATTERQDAVMLGQRRPHHAFLDTTELLFPVGGKDLGDATSGLLFDRDVGVEHLDVEGLGQPSPDRGLTGSRQSHQYRFGCHRSYPDARTSVTGSRSATDRR